MKETGRTPRPESRSSPLARRFLGGAAWSVASAVVSSGVTLLVMIIVARILHRESYGRLVVIQSTLGMFGTLAGLGVGTAAIRYIAALRSRDGRRLLKILGMAEHVVIGFGLATTLALIASSHLLAGRLLNAPDLGTPIACAAATVFFTALDGYQKSVLIGFEAMRAFAVASVAGVLIGAPILLGAAYQFELIGVAVGTAVVAGLQCVISRHFAKEEVRRHSSIPQTAPDCESESEMSILWGFALPALLAGALVGPVHWAAQAILANTLT